MAAESHRNSDWYACFIVSTIITERTGNNATVGCQLMCHVLTHQVLAWLGSALVQLDRLTDALAAYSQLLHVLVKSGSDVDTARLTHTHLLKTLASRAFNTNEFEQALQYIDDAIHVSSAEFMPIVLLDLSSIQVLMECRGID